MSDPVDWTLAVRTARRFAKPANIDSTYHARSLDASFVDIAHEAHHYVTELTGLPTPCAPEIRVVDRATWAEANVASMRRLLSPAFDRLRTNTRSPLIGLARSAAGVEVGTLLGMMSKRVLGQYDLSPYEPPSGEQRSGTQADDTVYFVRPNLLEMEKRYSFRPDEFRKWVAFHELTHHVQFRGVPWLPEYFHSLVKDLTGMLDPDPRRLLLAATRILEGIVTRTSPIGDAGLAGLFATSAQLSLLSRMQTLMSVIEGHATWVMNVLGRRHTETSDRMAATMSDRRASPSHIARLVGLEAKMRQYDIGERFFEHLDTVGGPPLTKLVWRSPEYLPTEQELLEPNQWIQRTAIAAG